MPPRQCRQRRPQAVRAQQRQQADLGQQRQHQGHGAKGTNARVLHDVQRPFAVVAAAQAVGHIGQAILVKAARHHHRGHRAQHRSHQGCQRLLRPQPLVQQGKHGA